MKRWQAILINMVLAGAMYGTKYIHNDWLQTVAVSLLIAAGAPSLASRASKHNPDGSPAQVAWHTTPEWPE